MAYSKPLNMTEIKGRCKKEGISFADYLIACVTLALSQLCSSETPYCLVSMPFTLSDFPKDYHSINMGNNFASVPVRLEFP